MVSTVAGDFGRAVQVDKIRVGQGLHPAAQVGGRHDLAAEQHAAHTVRRAVVQPVQRADQTQRGHRPGQGRDAVPAQKVHQRRRLGEQLPGDDDQRRAGIQGRIDVLDRHIKVKRRLIADHVVFTDAEQAGEGRDKGQHRAVADDHALGRAGRAGGEKTVQRVGIGHAVPDARERRGIGRGLDQVLSQQHRALRAQLRGEAGMIAVGDEQGRVQHVQHLPQTRLRQRGVQRHIKAACLHRAEKGIQGISALFHQHRDRRAGRKPRCERRTHALAVCQQFVPAAGAVLVDHCRLIRQAGGGRLEKFQYIVHNYLVSIGLVGIFRRKPDTAAPDGTGCPVSQER